MNRIAAQTPDTTWDPTPGQDPREVIGWCPSCLTTTVWPLVEWCESIREGNYRDDSGRCSCFDGGSE